MHIYSLSWQNTMTMSIRKKDDMEAAAKMSDKEKKASSALWRPLHDIYKVWVRLLF